MSNSAENSLNDTSHSKQTTHSKVILNTSPVSVDIRLTKQEIPLVFVNDATTHRLFLEHPAVFKYIAEEFSAKLSQSGISPNDPRYEEIWNEAMSQANEEVRNEFGVEAWQAIMNEQKFSSQ